MPPKLHRTTLEKIEAKIAECQEIIANKQAEIRELRNTAAVVRRLEGNAESQPFAGLKIRECAEILLREKSPQHFKELAREAVARGYVSQKGGDLETIAKSFWTTLNIAPLFFEKLGAGNFRLTQKPPPTPRRHIAWSEGGGGK